MSTQKAKKKFRLDPMALLVVFIPIIIAAVVAFVYWRMTGLLPIPGLKWNDEAAYLQLIKTCLESGQPIGYWGFDGNHAIWGTGSAWSPAILWPYAIWGLILPVERGFVFWVNLIYISGANLLFLRLVIPNVRQKMRLVLLQVTSAVLILYLSVNMSEVFRYAIAIVLAGMLYRLLFIPCKKVFSYVIVPLFLIAAIQVYVFYAFCIPIYVFAVMRKRKWYLKTIVSLITMGGVAGASYYLLHLISSNYNIYKTEGLLQSISQRDFVGALKAFVWMFKEGSVGVFNLWSYIYSNPLIPWHVLFAIVLVGVGIWLILRNRIHQRKHTVSGITDESHDMELGVCVAYSILLFMSMYVTLYTIESYTFMRGTQIVVIFSLYLLAMMKNKRIFLGILLIQLVGMFFLPQNMEYYMQDRYRTEAELQGEEELEQKFSMVVTMTESEDPWDNTIILYTMEPRVITAMPAGVGVNFVLTPGTFPEEAKYLLFSKEESDQRNGEWVEQDYWTFYEENEEKLNQDYINAYEDSEYIIYQKR